MRKTTLIVLALLAAALLYAQSPLDDLQYVAVYQDSTITRLLEDKISGAQRQERLIDGFRVQVFSSNEQQKGKAEALAMEKRLAPVLDLPVYVMYLSPSWKVRIGDFTSFEDAQNYKNELVTLYPDLQASCYVIGDQIRVIQ